jgi:hypothetical protein
MVMSGMCVFIPYLNCCKRDQDKHKDPTSTQRILFAVSACFSAGMLMSISILHILPEANEMYHGVLAKEMKADGIREMM